jgi:hypothetical protein
VATAFRIDLGRRWLLRARREWAAYRSTAEQGDEIAPSDGDCNLTLQRGAFPSR